MLATARLLGQASGAALVAMIFSLAPLRGTIICIEVAVGCAVLAAAVSTTRLGTAAATSAR